MRLARAGNHGVSQKSFETAVRTGRTHVIEPTDHRSEYANEDGVVDTQGVREATADWREDEIDTEMLREVIDAWRSGDPIA